MTLTGNNALHVGVENTTYASDGDQKSLIQFNDAATGTVSLGGDSSDLTLHMDIDTDILIAMRELDSVGILLTDGTITGSTSILRLMPHWKAWGSASREWMEETLSFPEERTRFTLLP